MPDTRTGILRFIEDAAFLRREFIGRNVDNREEQVDRAKTLYFYDTDVVFTYCRPWDNGPDGETGTPEEVKAGYGAVFRTACIGGIDGASPNARIEREISTADILARYVLLELRNTGIPPYQFAGHFEETKNIFTRDALRLAREQDRRLDTPSRTREALMRGAAAQLAYRAEEGDDHETLLGLAADIIDRMKLLDWPQDKKGRLLGQAQRFVELNARVGGFYLADMIGRHFRGSGGEHDKVADAVETVMRPSREIAERIEHLKMRLGQRLKQHGHNPDAQKIESDSDAVARIFHLNLVLRRLGWRAVFVTGTWSILETCYNDAFRDIPLLEDHETVESASTYREVFTQKYIRHLHAYATEALLEPDRKSEFIGWLDGLLATQANPTGFDETTLTRIIADIRSGCRTGEKAAVIEKLFGGDVTENAATDRIRVALSEWRSMTEKALTLNRVHRLNLSDDEAKRLQQRIVAIIRMHRSGRNITSWDTLTRLLKEHFARAQDRTYLNWSKIGNDAILKNIKESQRNPPDLIFDHLENANRIFRRLCSAQTYTNEEFDRDYAALSDHDTRNAGVDLYDGDLEADDRLLNYLRYVVMGAVFAGANLWGVALSQAQRAVDIIRRAEAAGARQAIPAARDTEGRITGLLSGREALLLCAVARRIIARTERDLRRSEDFLDDAIATFERDREVMTRIGAMRIRFEGERLALRIARYYMARSKEENHREHVSVASIDDYAAGIYEQAAILLRTEDMENRFAEMARNIAEVGRPFEDTTVDGLGYLSVAHICVNIVQCCIIRAWRRHNDRQETRDCPFTAEHLRTALELLEYFTEDERRARPDFHRLKATPIRALYRDAGARLYAEPDRFGFEEGEALDILFRKTYPGETRNVSEYDHWRFESLHAFGGVLNAKTPVERRALAFGTGGPAP